MAFAFTASTRDVLEQIVRDPRFHRLTEVPTFPMATVGLLISVFLVFGGSSYLWLSGLIPTWLVILINGVLLFAIFTPLHDATHRTASGNPRVNDLIGTIALIGFIPGVTTRIYRYLHLEHHRYAGNPDKDPDDVFVTAKWPWVPFVIATPDITWTIWYLRAWKTRPVSERIEFLTGISIYVLWHVLWLTSPYAYAFTILWWIPQRIGMSITVYFFARIQHPEGVEWEEAPFQTTVHIPTNPMFRWMMLSQTEHHIHHLMPSVPFYGYHKAFELGDHLLREQNIPQRGFFRPASSILLPEQATEDRQSARLTSKVSVADGICAFEFISTDPDMPLAGFEPGAHLDLHLKGGLVRQYSLYAPDDGTGTYRIAVKREETGRGGSKQVHELEVGDTVELGLPRNNFPLAAGSRDTVLIAGGIGITPLWSMAYALEDQSRPFSLTVFARSQADMAFYDRLPDVPFFKSVRTVFDDEGRDIAEEIAKTLGSWNAGRQLYVCGPSGFMDLVVEIATDNGWPKDAISSEAFVAPDAYHLANEPFRVILGRSGRELEVGKNEYLIDVLHRNGVPVPCSCTQGICGSCITGVLDGEVDHRDAILSDPDRQSGRKMTVCVSRAKGSSLTLDL